MGRVPCPQLSQVNTTASNGTTAGSDPFFEVFVKHLDPWYDRDDKVQDLFRQCGIVVHVKLVRNETGAPIGTAYVTFAEPDQALMACKQLNGLRNRYGEGLYVDRAYTRTEWVGRPRIVGLFRVIVKNLSYQVNEELLVKRFERFGDIISVKLTRDDRGVSQGHAIIVFLSREAAQRAISEGDGMLLATLTVQVEQYYMGGKRKPRQEKSISGRKLEVNGITDRETIRTVFDRYGNIDQISISISKNSAFVTFSDKGMADKALANTNLIKAMVPVKGLAIKLCEPEAIPVSDKFECTICFNKKYNESLMPIGCDHKYCWQCVANYLELIIHKDVNYFKCPEPGCHKDIDEQHIEILVDEEVFKKYKAMTVHKAEVGHDKLFFGNRALRQFGPPFN